MLRDTASGNSNNMLERARSLQMAKSSAIGQDTSYKRRHFVQQMGYLDRIDQEEAFDDKHKITRPMTRMISE